jgi:hypothetical protein
LDRLREDEMILKAGDKGEAVKRVQKALKAAGFKVQDDGDFGKLTEAAVKQFQLQHHLGTDGRAGPKTLAALGLDENANLDKRTAGGTTPPVEEITFSDDDVEAPPVVRSVSRDFANAMERLQDALIGRMQDALQNFETTMVFASSREAHPDVLGTVLATTFDFAVDEAIDATGPAAPVLKLAKAVFTKSREELQRAAAAASSNAVGVWIQQQRTALGNTRGTFDLTALEQEIELGYLESPDRTAYFNNLLAEAERYKRPSLPAVEDLQYRLFVNWINANSRGDESGFIDVKINAEDDLKLESCVVNSASESLDDKIGDALNRLMGVARDFQRPMNMPVRKRVQFYTENFMPGGHSWSSGWLNERNQMTGAPVLPKGAEIWAAQNWWGLINRFERD